MNPPGFPPFPGALLINAMKKYLLGLASTLLFAVPAKTQAQQDYAERIYLDPPSVCDRTYEKICYMDVTSGSRTASIFVDIGGILFSVGIYEWNTSNVVVLVNTDTNTTIAALALNGDGSLTEDRTGEALYARGDIAMLPAFANEIDYLIDNRSW